MYRYMYIYIYIHIYLFIYIEREIYVYRPADRFWILSREVLTAHFHRFDPALFFGGTYAGGIHMGI